MKTPFRTRVSVAIGVALIAALPVGPAAQPATGRLQLDTISARPEFVSGGDVLVRVAVPSAVPMDEAKVTLNGADVTTMLRRDEARHQLVGLVTGLQAGRNALLVAARGTSGARLTVVNHPIAGPVFSGPHEQPFLCETEAFKLQSGETLGKPLDRDCSIERRVDFYYRSTSGGALKPVPGMARLKPDVPAAGQLPSDVAQVTTSTGATVPYVVRIETGTINRAVYQIAMLDGPTSWNQRLIYTHGGGCTGGWYRQGANTGGVVDDVMLRQGYAVASSSLNVFGNNCNDLLASETLMMVKERFVEAHGTPRFTIGWGCSGGSYQQLQTADNYPGLLDGIIPCRTFPDVGFSTIMTITDARLLNRYFRAGPAVAFSDEQKRAIAGFHQLITMVAVDDDAGRIQVSEFCPEVLPKEQRYDAAANPRGARCAVFDHAVNAYGRDPKTGFARRPLDNVGVQYGLRALNAGTITKEQFLDLNEHIGGFDNDGNVVRTRSVADPAAVRAAYRTGRLTYTGAGLAGTPIIDYRNYLDDAEKGDIHLRFHSFSLRDRLTKVNGHADNHVILIEDNRYRGNSSSPLYQDALKQMDRWLTALTDDASNDPLIVKIRRAKPADLVDACWTRDAAPQRIAEKQTRDASSRCQQLYPSASFPREVAGGPVANDIAKCQLKPVDGADYSVTFTSDETARLRRIFPSGVCDWSKPGVEQQKLSGTWLRFGENGT
jgi:uncharacterized tannase-like protein DUF6351